MPSLARRVSALAVTAVAGLLLTGPAHASALVTPVGAPHLFLDSIGRATVAGSVHANADVERVGVRVALVDRAGRTLTTLDIATLLRRVPSGREASYRFQTDGMSGTGYWPTARRAVVLATSARLASGPVDQEYRVTLDRPVTSLGVQELDGTVSGHAGADLLVALTFRDAAGRVVDAGLAFPRGGRRVARGGSAPFTLRRYVDADSRQPTWATVTATAEGDGSGLSQVVTPATTGAAQPPSTAAQDVARRSLVTARPIPAPAAPSPHGAEQLRPSPTGTTLAPPARASQPHPDGLPPVPVLLALVLLASAGGTTWVVRR